MFFQNTTAKGQHYEELAAQYLQQHNLQIITRNYACKMGEIDLIAKDGEFLVFVEVRFRNSQDFGGSLASITKAKQRRLSTTAKFYLSANKLWHINARFDLISIMGEQIEWLKNIIEQ